MIYYETIGRIGNLGRLRSPKILKVAAEHTMQVKEQHYEKQMKTLSRNI